MNPKHILIYGYGNPGRQDDGLGIALCDEIQRWVEDNGLDGIEVDSNYQLNIEDSATISDKDIVIFADASREEIEDFVLTELTPDAKVEFTMHHVSPGFVLHLCNEIYNRVPQSFLLHIKGYQWDFIPELSEEAKKNLSKSAQFIKNFIENYLSDPSVLKQKK